MTKCNIFQTPPSKNLINVGLLAVRLGLGAGIAGLNIAPEVPVVTFIRHVAFGLTLGLMIKSNK